MNERHRIRYPRKMLLAGGDSLGRAAALLGEKLPFQPGRSHASSFLPLINGLPGRPAVGPRPFPLRVVILCAQHDLEGPGAAHKAREVLNAARPRRGSRGAPVPVDRTSPTLVRR